MASVTTTDVPNEGFDELQGRLALDSIANFTHQTAAFGAGSYYLDLLGTPSLTGRSELQYDGHHYACANTCQGGKVAGVTPGRSRHKQPFLST